jgi:hypothetical protein
MNTVFPLLQACFLCTHTTAPEPHTFLFHWRKRRHLKSSFQTNNYYCRGVINLSSPSSPSGAFSCLQIKIISCELQNISGNTVIKYNLLLFLLILLYYYYCNRHTAPAPPQPSVRCAPVYKNVGQRWCNVLDGSLIYQTTRRYMQKTGNVVVIQTERCRNACASATSGEIN